VKSKATNTRAIYLKEKLNVGLKVGSYLFNAKHT